MPIVETFVGVKKCQNALLTMYDKDSMREKQWSLTKTGLAKVLSACAAVAGKL
jgi:hypothetical protein